MSILNLKNFSVFGLFGLLLLTLMFPLVSAQERTGSGLQISPTLTDLTGQPGEQKTFSINVKNVTQGDILAKVVLNDFESDGATGTPKIIVDNTKRTPYTLDKMLQGFEDVPLKPGESKQVNLTINIPSDTVPGAYYGAVRYSAIPKDQLVPTDTQQVALIASIAHLVFLSVPGDVTEQIKLESLKITDERGSSGIFFKKPTQASLTVKNLGNGFARPFGNVVIKNSSNKTIFSYDVNKTDPKGIVLPNSTRIFDDKIENIKAPGKYKAIASVAYGNGGEVVPFEVSFWYLPFWFVALLALILVALVVGGYMIYKKVNRGSHKRSKKA